MSTPEDWTKTAQGKVLTHLHQQANKIPQFTVEDLIESMGWNGSRGTVGGTLGVMRGAKLVEVVGSRRAENADRPHNIYALTAMARKMTPIQWRDKIHEYQNTRSPLSLATLAQPGMTAAERFTTYFNSSVRGVSVDRIVRRAQMSQAIARGFFSRLMIAGMVTCTEPSKEVYSRTGKWSIAKAEELLRGPINGVASPRRVKHDDTVRRKVGRPPKAKAAKRIVVGVVTAGPDIDHWMAQAEQWRRDSIELARFKERFGRLFK